MAFPGNFAFTRLRKFLVNSCIIAALLGFIINYEELLGFYWPGKPGFTGNLRVSIFYRYCKIPVIPSLLGQVNSLLFPIIPNKFPGKAAITQPFTGNIPAVNESRYSRYLAIFFCKGRFLKARSILIAIKIVRIAQYNSRLRLSGNRK